MKHRASLSIVFLGVIALIPALFTSCTENARARSFGGSANYTVAANQKLVTIAWKEQSAWVLTRQRKEGEKPEVYRFKEKSSMGIVEGEIVITELP